MRYPTALALPLALCLASCTIFAGGRIDTCGEHPADGGPAVIVTQDQELCDVVRLRVQRQLDGTVDLKRETLDRLVDRSLGWEQKRTLEDLVAVVRKDAGDAFADEVKRAVDAVIAQSQREMPQDCEDRERCLVKGAAKGARIALLTAQPAPPPKKDAKPAAK